MSGFVRRSPLPSVNLSILRYAGCHHHLHHCHPRTPGIILPDSFDLLDPSLTSALNLSSTAMKTMNPSHQHKAFITIIIVIVITIIIVIIIVTVSIIIITITSQAIQPLPLSTLSRGEMKVDVPTINVFATPSY